MNRYGFLGRRLLQTIPVLFGITVITFFLLRLIPGDPALQILGQHYTPKAAAELRNALGLDKPLWEQYVLFMKHLFHGNLGDSINYREPAATVIFERLPATLFLVVYAAVIAAVISIPVGVISALRKGRVFDQVARVWFLIAFAMPELLARDHPHPDLLNPHPALSRERLRHGLRRPPAIPVPTCVHDRPRVLDDPRPDAPREHALGALK